MAVAYDTELDMPIIFSMDFYDLSNLYKEQIDEKWSFSKPIWNENCSLNASLGKLRYRPCSFVLDIILLSLVTIRNLSYSSV